MSFVQTLIHSGTELHSNSNCGFLYTLVVVVGGGFWFIQCLHYACLAHTPWLALKHTHAYALHLMMMGGLWWCLCLPFCYMRAACLPVMLHAHALPQHSIKQHTSPSLYAY